jgi:hypothetical protein
MTEVGDYAPLASPELTGTPLAPTASANTNTTQVATTAFVMTEVGDYVTTTTANSTYAPKASPEFTGNVTIQSLDMDDIVAGDVIYGSGADTLAISQTLMPIQRFRLRKAQTTTPSVSMWRVHK